MATIKYGSKGKAVVNLQNALISLGYPLPRWGADGSWGDELETALRAFRRDHRQSAPYGADVALQVAAAVAAVLPPACRLVDRTGCHSGALRHGDRPWQQINAIVLHQTACRLAANPERWDTLSAHIGIPPAPKSEIYLINPLTAYMYHANSLNRETVGIEVGGNFEGVDGKPSTAWKGGGVIDRATAAQIVAAREAVAWVVAAVAAHGGVVTDILAHRQASETRRADPGSRIWAEVGLWAYETLGLRSRADLVHDGSRVGTGRPIPREWDPRATARY